MKPSNSFIERKYLVFYGKTEVEKGKDYHKNGPETLYHPSALKARKTQDHVTINRYLGAKDLFLTLELSSDNKMQIIQT